MGERIVLHERWDNYLKGEIGLNQLLDGVGDSWKIEGVRCRASCPDRTPSVTVQIDGNRYPLEISDRRKGTMERAYQAVRAFAERATDKRLIYTPHLKVVFN